MSLFHEFKRRKVVRVAVVYAATAFAVLQGADIMLPNLGVPDWAMRFLVALVLLGFPIALVLAWALEVTPDGVKRTGAAPEEAEEGTPSLLGTRTLVVAGLLVAVGIGLSAGWVLKPGAGAGPAAEAGSAGAVDMRASIAVLPFDNLSPDPEQGYFADGLHDDLLTQLSRIAALRVTSRTSVQEYRGSAKSIPTIARELGVAAVLEGGVQRSGDRLRINVQLIDGATDDHLWAETYDSDLTVSDIFDIQTRIATSITDALRARLTKEEREAIAEQPTASFEAYEAYLAGLAATVWAATDTAALLFDRAAQLDPGFAEAWAAAAQAWAWQFRIVGDDITAAALQSEYRARAGRALERARELAPGSRETRLAEGYLQYYVAWDFDAAGRTFGGLIADYPQDAEMYYAAALIDRRQGRWDRAEERVRTAARLDPSSVIAHDMAWVLVRQRRWEEAERVARLAHARHPEDPWVNEVMAEILVARGAPPDRIEPYLDRGRADIEVVVTRRLKAGEPGLAAFYRRISAVPVERWLRPGDRPWSLAVLAEAAGLPAAPAHADSAIADLSALDRIDVALDAPLAERRAAAFGHAKRGLAMAIMGRREQAESDLRRSRALLRPGDDNIDHFTVASFLAHAWAILGNADEFFAELTPYAHGPAHLYARQFTDDPILSRFADDPRHGALIRALQSP
jgi:TolB-like protein